MMSLRKVGNEMKIRIKETLSRVVDVDAETEADAISIVEHQYADEKIVLDADDFDDVEFEVTI